MIADWEALEHPEIKRILTTAATKVSDKYESIHDADDLWMQTAEAIGTGRFGDAIQRYETEPGLLYGDIYEFMVKFVRYEHVHYTENESYEVRYLEGAYE